MSVEKGSERERERDGCCLLGAFGTVRKPLWLSPINLASRTKARPC